MAHFDICSNLFSRINQINYAENIENDNFRNNKLHLQSF